MAPKLIQCIKFSFSLTAGARFWWIKNKSVPHSSSVFACRRGKNTCAPSIVYRLLIGWNCHTTWSQGNLHYMRLHFLKLDREFFCLQPSLARLYSAAASPSERLRSDGSLAINKNLRRKQYGVVDTIIFSVFAARINKQTRLENTASDTFRLISWHLVLISGIFCMKE